MEGGDCKFSGGGFGGCGFTGGGPFGNGGGGGIGVVGSCGEWMSNSGFAGGGCGNGGVGTVGSRCGFRCCGSTARGEVLVCVGSSGSGKFVFGSASGGGSLR